jgi:hypothetical protein
MCYIINNQRKGISSFSDQVIYQIYRTSVPMSLRAKCQIFLYKLYVDNVYVPLQMVFCFLYCPNDSLCKSSGFCWIRIYYDSLQILFSLKSKQTILRKIIVYKHSYIYQIFPYFHEIYLTYCRGLCYLLLFEIMFDDLL